MKKYKIELLDDVKEITVPYKDWWHHFKELADDFSELLKHNALMAAKSFKIGNMYTYRNLMDFEGKPIKFVTQTGERIDNNSIVFLN